MAQMRRQQKRLTDQSAFTLIEVMITVAVVAILVSIAVPTYRDFVLRTNRVEGIDAVMTAMLCQERVYSRTNAYDGTEIRCFPNIPEQTFDLTTNKYYQVIINSGGQTVMISARPQGNQANDPCGELTLNEKGVKTASGDDDVKCWKGR